MTIGWEPVEAEWTIEDVGGFLLKSIANDLYGPEEVLREYVQNAVDACAKFQKTTGEEPKRSIQIRIDPINKSLIIFDCGIGMDKADIKQAKSVAVSPKLEENDDYVGFRGIGIWSGLPACERIEIISTKLNDPRRYKLTIKCKEIVDNYARAIHIGELMRGRFTIEESQAQLEEHFTYVKLVNVCGEYSRMLSVDDITRYASQNLPVLINPDWKHYDALQEILSKVPYSINYNLTINGLPVYREFPSAVDKPEELTLTDRNDREIGIAWMSRSTRAGDISIKRGSYEATNFCVRVKNFAIGDRLLYFAGGQRNLMNWFAGEIYITDPDVKPDTNRTRFNPDEKGMFAEETLKNFYALMAARARAWSAEVNALEDCEEARKKIEILDGLLEQKAQQGPIAVAVQSLKETEAKVLRYLHDVNTPEKSPGIEKSETKKALRKPKVKGALTQTAAAISAACDRAARVESLEFFELTPPDVVPIDGKKRRSNSRTARSTCPQITFGEALALEAGSGRDTDSSSKFNKNYAYQVELGKVLGAFRAVVASVLGENSDAYRQILQRLNSELTTRGIVDVDQ